MDARMLVTDQGTGVSSYARQLRQAQLAIEPRSALLGDRGALARTAPAPLGRPGRWLRALAPLPRRAVADAADPALLHAPDLFRVAQVHFDIYRRPLPVRLPGPPGIMHWTYPVPLYVHGWCNLYTVHDVIPLRRPELTHINAARYRRMLAALARCATRLIAVSETARAEIVETIGCAPEFVTDCGIAVEPATQPAALLPPGLVPGGFLLVCGTVEPRKNIVRILDAYRLSGLPLPLVVAGPDGPVSAAIDRLIARTPGALRLPYLDDAVMGALLSHAAALVMPSLAEGFGLPVAEAMALGTPVVTADRGALAETAAAAALTVDPEDVPAIAGALQRIGTDQALRAKLADAGRRNAARFTPARFAARLTQVYGAVMAGRT